MPQVWLSVAALQEYQVVLQCTGALPAAQGDLRKAHQPVRRMGKVGSQNPPGHQEGLGGPASELPGTIAQ